MTVSVCLFTHPLPRNLTPDSCFFNSHVSESYLWRSHPSCHSSPFATVAVTPTTETHEPRPPSPFQLPVFQRLASSLPALSNLRLASAGGPIGTSLRALVGSLQSLPKLQDLHLNGFRDWFSPREGPASITLRNLRFTDCDFLPVLEYLHAPNLRSFIVHGTRPNNNATPLPFLRDPALLSRVQIAPILGNRALRSISVTARTGTNKRFLAI